METWTLTSPSAAAGLTLEHRPISFPNFPYEWSPLMLHSAATATLHFAASAIEAGYELKDANPGNLMFESAKPVFLDFLSFVPDTATECIWRPHAQFVRTFLYPLLANRYFGLHLDEVLLLHRDGLEPERVAAMCSFWRKWTPPFLSLVTLPVLFRNREDFTPRRAADRDESKAIRLAFIRKTRQLLDTLTPKQASNSITGYLDEQTHYAPAEFARKEAAVREAIGDMAGKSLLDIGANTGHFSFLAAESGARVVAIERDPAAVDQMFRRLLGSNSAAATVLPLVIDISRPFGAAGWENAEQASFLERAQRAGFDTLLVLGLLHHLLVSERVPLTHVLALLRRLTTSKLILEYIDPADSQFRRIARGRDALHRDLTAESFEQAVRDAGFEIAGQVPLNATRTLYTLHVRNAGSIRAGREDES